MTIILESVEVIFGQAFVVTATKDKYHRTVVREFFAYADAQAFCHELLKCPMSPEYQALFKRRGL